MSIKAQIWDLEGVLLLAKDGSVPASVAKRLNAPLDEVHAVFHGEFNDRTDIGEFSQIDFWHHLLDTLRRPNSDIYHLHDFINNDLYVDQHLLNVVRQYRTVYKTAMISNYSDVLRPLLETRWHVDDAFNEIIISWEVKLIKPQPEIFNLALDRLGCQAQEAVFIDDRLRNIQGAQQMGMHVVHFKEKEQALADLEKILARHA